jgi:hypothetical protein
MKKISIIIFLGIMVIGVLGYAGRLGNDYLGHSTGALQPLSDSIIFQSSQEVKSSEPLQTLTFAVLFGTGLVGMVIIRRK